MITQNLGQILKENAYPGRGIVIGKSEDRNIQVNTDAVVLVEFFEELVGAHRAVHKGYGLTALVVQKAVERPQGVVEIHTESRERRKLDVTALRSQCRVHIVAICRTLHKV